MPIIYRQASFPEFYFGAIGDVTLSNCDLLLALLCDYDYRSSRCYTAVPAEAAKNFSDTVAHSMFGVFHELFSGGTVSLRSEETKTISHTAVCGALYAKEKRIRLTVRYAPMADATEIRALVTTAVKYSENLYRAQHGNRNRLAVQGLPEGYRAILDAYYRVFFGEKEKAKATAAEPAYMAQYAPAETGVTLSRAELTVYAGKSARLTASVLPKNAFDKKVTWSSSDESVASVSRTGTVTGKSEGTAVLTARTASGATAQCMRSPSAQPA